MSIELKVPSVGESISEVEIGQWLKKEGDPVQDGETLAVLETEKATVDLPSPATGTLGQLLKQQGQVATVGEVIALIEPGTRTGSKPQTPDAGSAQATTAAEDKQAATPASPARTEAKVMPAAARVLTEAGMDASQVEGTGPGGRVLKEDALQAVGSKGSSPAPSTETKPVPPPASRRKVDDPGTDHNDRQEEVVRMSKLRRTVAARLVSAKRDMALLTTFNEVDMSTVMSLRKEIQESFQQRHGVKLGFMSFFVKAVIDALKLVPQLNAEIRDDNIVYRNYYDIGVAIGGGKGLVVPVLRNAERMGFARIEKAIVDFANRARDGKLKPDELDGGTFTISNGGVYGSLLSTPIVSPPQSGVLGMHTIQDRPVAVQGQVVIRPMMYVALTYDHRIVDGKEAVSFLKRVKEVIENPSRILLEA